MVTIVKAWDKGMSITRDATLSVFKIMKHASIKDETLHNRFEEIVKKTFTRKDDRAYMLAYFDLLRTTRSDTSRMMQLLRSDGPYMQQLFRPTTYSAGLNILSLTCLLARKKCGKWEKIGRDMGAKPRVRPSAVFVVWGFRP